MSFKIDELSVCIGVKLVDLFVKDKLNSMFCDALRKVFRKAFLSWTFFSVTSTDIRKSMNRRVWKIGRIMMAACPIQLMALPVIMEVDYNFLIFITTLCILLRIWILIKI